MTGPAPLSLRRNLDPRTWPTWEVVRPALFRLNRLTVAARPIPRSNVRVSAYSVWRLKNRDIMQDFVADLGPETAIHLHCLDTPPADGELAELTDSDGPGDRIPLLASLMADHPPRPGDWVLLFDDDAYFRPGDWSSFVAVAEQAGFDICQPSHDQASHFSHPMTRARFFSLARRTDFVEVGPIVLLSPAAARACLPFPADVVMGWGSGRALVVTRAARTGSGAGRRHTDHAHRLGRGCVQPRRRDRGPRPLLAAVRRGRAEGHHH